MPLAAACVVLAAVAVLAASVPAWKSRPRRSHGGAALRVAPQSRALLGDHVDFISVSSAQALRASSTGKVDRVSDHGGKDAMAWCPHGREPLPAINYRVIHFHFAEQARILAAEHVE